MLKVGITGQAGFIGTHLFNYLNLKKTEILTIPFEDTFFDDEEQLNRFVRDCDAIVHLAAVNRHSDPQVIYNTNIDLVKRLIRAMELTDSKPHVLFSSSTQEERDNLYGRSKQEGRELFESWALRNGSHFTGLVIPNVFGPFGKPFYNSVVATFCHQLTHGEQPEIQIDAEIQLIYVTELADVFYRYITGSNNDSKVVKFRVPYSAEVKVTDILKLLESYRQIYFLEHCFPKLNSPFEFNLFNTFRSYIPGSGYFPVALKKNVDNRGLFIEAVKTMTAGQFSFSTTLPGITRGNHYHIRKIERFTVIKGKALIEIRRIGTNDIISYELDGETPSFVDMPVWYTHNITNTGRDELITLFWINEFFNPDDPDTFFEKV